MDGQTGDKDTSANATSTTIMTKGLLELYKTSESFAAQSPSSTTLHSRYACTKACTDDQDDCEFPCSYHTVLGSLGGKANLHWGRAIG